MFERVWISLNKLGDVDCSSLERNIDNFKIRFKDALDY